MTPFTRRRFLAVLVLTAKQLRSLPGVRHLAAAARLHDSWRFQREKDQARSCQLAPQGLVWNLLAPELVWPAARFSLLAPRDFLSLHRAIRWRNLSRVECVCTA